MLHRVKRILPIVIFCALAPAALAGESADRPEQAMSPVNINQADEQALARLDGVGEAKAEAIVSWREENGRFESKKQLMEVNGIGEATFEDNRQMIVLN